MTFANGRGAQLQPCASGVLVAFDSARSGTGRAIDDDGVHLSDSELSAAPLAFSEDGTLLVDREVRRVIETAIGAQPKTLPLVQDAAVLNGHPFAPIRLLGNLVRDLTQQHSPLRQMRLQVEELARANRCKDEFLAMLSHELRNPLASIHYAVSLMGKQMGEAPAQRRTQALIERQLHRMTHLVDELLDVSRITSGRLHLQRERLDLRDIMRNAIETLERNINERHHRLSTELAEMPVWMEGDPCRLEQVFVNLLANASRYTDDGGELAVSVLIHEDQAVVRVRDSGIGITAEALPHIFDLFKQAHEGDPRSRDGLGVGLAVVRSLIELHGGSVTAASSGSGHGSEFTVRLPMAGS
jgi:signal transduction histidine kinase